MRVPSTQWRIKAEIGKFIIWTILVGYTFLALVPVLWTLSTSFKPRSETLEMPPSLIPHNFTLDNYVKVFQKTPILLSLRNSSIIVAGTLFLCLTLGLLAAYGLSKFFNFNSQKFFLYFALATRAVAPAALVVPFMIIGRRLHILDTFLILILADSYMWLPFLIWLMKGFIDVIPEELVDASKIDGCSNLGILRRVIIPLSIPGLVSVAILIFIDTWNELLFAMALAESISVKPITTTMTYFYTDIYTVYGWMTSAGIVGVIPAVIFMLFFQRYIVKGVIAGAVKG